jgi:hypothetical protein
MAQGADGIGEPGQRDDEEHVLSGMRHWRGSRRRDTVAGRAHGCGPPALKSSAIHRQCRRRNIVGGSGCPAPEEERVAWTTEVARLP